MRIPRVYVDLPLEEGGRVVPPEEVGHYLARVLRLKEGAPLVVFNGQGGSFEAVFEKRGLRLGAFRPQELESPLSVTLLQGISRGERMDFAIQKAVELGVTAIVPVVTQRCEVRLDEMRARKRLERWRKVAVHACEQCGRNRPPVVAPILPLASALAEGRGLRLVLHPGAEEGLKDLEVEASITLLVGPEGGLSREEIQAAQREGFRGLRLGPRILRTETAAVTALAAIQTLWGDLA